MPELSDRQMEFLKAEHRAMLEKIAFVRADIARAETIYPLAIAAVYVWNLTAGPRVELLWILVMWVPVPIAFLGLVKLLSRYRLMHLVERYFIKIEQEFYGAPSDWGWERFYRDNPPPIRFEKARERIATALFVITVILALGSPLLFDELSQHREAASPFVERTS